MAQDVAPHFQFASVTTKERFHDFMASEPEGRFEFVDGQVIDMTGGTIGHANIGGRFVVVIGSQIDLDTHQIAGSDCGVETDTTVRYPDTIVVSVDEDFSKRWARDPHLIVEVMSPSSEETDLGRKVTEYTALASLHCYIVADPDVPRCSVWQRSAKGTFPKRPKIVEGADGVIAIPALGLTIALADVYRQVLRAKP